MTYYSKKFRKSYKLGSKPESVLRKQLERTLIKDIDLMQIEIENLELKRIEYIEYRKRRIQFEHEVSFFIEPLNQKRLKLINDNSNYKTGIKYLFKKRELKDEITKTINIIDDQLINIYVDLENKYNIKKGPYRGYELNVEEIDIKIDYDVNRRIKYFQRSIATYQSELKLKQNKNQQIENIKGIAAQALNKTRQRANQIKSNMVNNNYCPYCGELIAEVHVDHIYPVAKGGLSTTKNMVRVCSTCNLRKKDLTLSQFVKKYKLDRGFIEGNLDLLNKAY